MNGLLPPFIISLAVIIDSQFDNDIFTTLARQAESLAVLWFGLMLILPFFWTRILGMRLILILILFTIPSLGISITSYHTIQDFKITHMFQDGVRKPFHDQVPQSFQEHFPDIASDEVLVILRILWMLSDYGALLGRIFGPGLILCSLYTLFQQPAGPLNPVIKRKRAMIIKHIGRASYLSFACLMPLLFYMDVIGILSYMTVTAVLMLSFMPMIFHVHSFTIFSLSTAIYSLFILAISWRYINVNFLGRLMLSLLPAIWSNIFIFLFLLFRK